MELLVRSSAVAESDYSHTHLGEVCSDKVGTCGDKTPPIRTCLGISSQEACSQRDHRLEMGMSVGAEHVQASFKHVHKGVTVGGRLDFFNNLSASRCQIF